MEYTGLGFILLRYMLLCFKLGEISPARPIFMFLSLVLFETARPSRNFAQLSDQRAFHSLQHCVIPVVRQFLFLNLVSPNFN